MGTIIRRYLIAGILVWVPIWVTILILQFLVDGIGNSLSLLPKQYQPQQLLGFSIPGLNFLIVLIIIFVTGMLVTNVLGNYLIQLWDKVVNRIPLVRSIYSGIKQMLETVFMPHGQAFRKVYLVEYPRRDCWTIAFQTSDTAEQISKSLQMDTVTLFIPATPNPTSGFYLVVPREDVREVDISVDQALKLVISLGVVKAKAKPDIANNVNHKPSSS